MMNREDRKAAVTAYKERKVEAGIVAVRCTPTGQVWVGPATNLGAIENRLRFSLANGGHMNRPLQEAWKTHGGEQFAIEILEALDEDETGALQRMMLKERTAHWTAKLGAAAL